MNGVLAKCLEGVYMKKIVLLCAGGLSTSMLVAKMREVAAADSYDCEIEAYGITEADSVVPESDITLLGPQIKFKMDSLREKYPDKVIEAIDMVAYGMMDGKKVIDMVRETIG